MWGRSLGVVVAMAMVLGGGVKADAEIYLWTDEQGVVHMTDQWSNVPESARARVIGPRHDASAERWHTGHGTSSTPS